MAHDAEPSEIAEVLVDSHRRFLDFVERRVGDRSAAEDILQEAFVRGMARSDQLRDEESSVAWFYRILRNAVIDHYRRKGAAGRAMSAAAADAEASHEPDAITHQAVCECVRRLADTLKPEYGEALRRVDVDGLQVKEFAAEARISANNAAVRVHRARAALRQRVEQSCGTCAEHGCLDCTCRR